MSSDEQLPSLNDIAATVAGGHVPDAHVLVALDREAINAILDGRNDSSFKTSWTRASSEVEKSWRALSAPADVRDRIEEVRRSAYNAIGNVTGRHELASHVSDDLEMIAKAAAAGLADPFVRSLWDLYESGTFSGLSSVRT